MTDQERDYVIFEAARKSYQGVKRGFQTEFVNFIKKHKDWKNVLILLLPAIQAQIKWRATAKGEFRPAWKNFQTWINQRCWEEELPSSSKPTQTVVEIKQCLVDHILATHYIKADVWLCDECRQAYIDAEPPRDFKGKPMPKNMLDKGRIEVMIQKQKAKR